MVTTDEIIQGISEKDSQINELKIALRLLLALYESGTTLSGANYDRIKILIK